MRRIYFVLFLYVMALTSGCVRWTDRDYELQEKAYEKERQEREAARQNHGGFGW